MSGVTTGGAPGQGNEAPAPPSISSAIMRGMMMFMFMNVAQRFAVQQGYFPSPSTAANSAATSNMPLSKSTSTTVTSTTVTSMMPPSHPHRAFPVKRPSCIWKPHTMLNLHVFITDTQELLLSENEFNCLDIPQKIESSEYEYTLMAEWHQNLLELESLDPSVNFRNDTLSLSIPRSVQFNETQVYAHVCLMQNNNNDAKATATDIANVNVKDVQFQFQRNFLYKTIPLSKYKKRKRIRDEMNLLSTTSAKETENGSNILHGSSSENEIEISMEASPLTRASANHSLDTTLLYLKPTLTLQIVDMSGMPFSDRNKIPAPIDKHMQWLNSTSAQFFPLLYPSDFWITQNSLVELNDTIFSSTLDIKVEQIKLWKWQLMSQMEDTWEKQSAASGGEEDGGTDMLRNMLLDTNPILLAITGIVSVLHTVFDILAFKNDVKFFKNKKNMEGLSLRSMVVNVFFQLVILLYLMDNETSFMVVCSNAMGVAIEMWKISRAVKISLFDENGKFQFRWNESETYKTSKTKEYDEIATDHLQFLTIPLVCGYGVYSLFHQKHRGWYSYILNTLVGFIYMFGFVNMTPQLFINYKLQSVAHLNWRTMTYKSINTFIDDLFGESNPKRKWTWCGFASSSSFFL